MTTEAPSPEYVVRLRSRHDFDATIHRITHALTTRGITIFADIDQAQAAARAGTALRPTRLILFGNPKVGTPIMAANPHTAVELPLKAVVWQDEQGGVNVDYLDPSVLLTKGYATHQSLTSPLQPVLHLFEQATGAA